ncbi:peptidylprolyl isomerase [Hyalangium versicolor]|uniref:peptidylprolyl isomerase n=1 Tax=Hyalangium versicolor TaxID=2861190 RepID=UPI001CCD3BE1|nr:peptidylprolyl isomerase [Hyalangium versicolor]
MDPLNVTELSEKSRLPEVRAPSLEGLSVTLPSPRGFTADDVRQRFLELARAHATERYRTPTEAIVHGDEVLLDLAAYSNGRLIPFSVRKGVWLTHDNEPTLPGLYAALIGHKPNEGLVVDIPLPPDYPLPALRRRPARFLIHIQAAREVTYPSLESPEFLHAFGRGQTVAEATRTIVEQMVAEAADFLLLEGQQRILEELASRTRVRIPAELIDEEIRRCWNASEGHAVRELEFSEQEQRESLDSWLRDETTRTQVEQRLRLALALGAICRQEGLTLTQERVERLLRERAAAAGLTLEQVAESLRTEPEHLAYIDQVAWHLMAVEYVMSRAQLRFEEP